MLYLLLILTISLSLIAGFVIGRLYEIKKGEDYKDFLNTVQKNYLTGPKPFTKEQEAEYFEYDEAKHFDHEKKQEEEKRAALKGLGLIEELEEGEE